MDNTMILIVSLLVFLAIFIVAVIVVSAIRRKDFRDQVTGKKPERKADPNQKVSYDKPSHENSQISIDREVLRTKSGQNLLGPR